MAPYMAESAALGSEAAKATTDMAMTALDLEFKSAEPFTFDPKDDPLDHKCNDNSYTVDDDNLHCAFDEVDSMSGNVGTFSPAVTSTPNIERNVIKLFDSMVVFPRLEEADSGLGETVSFNSTASVSALDFHSSASGVGSLADLYSPISTGDGVAPVDDARKRGTDCDMRSHRDTVSPFPSSASFVAIDTSSLQLDSGVMTQTPSFGSLSDIVHITNSSVVRHSSTPICVTTNSGRLGGTVKFTHSLSSTPFRDLCNKCGVLPSNSAGTSPMNHSDFVNEKICRNCAKPREQKSRLRDRFPKMQFGMDGAELESESEDEAYQSAPRLLLPSPVVPVSSNPATGKELALLDRCGSLSPILEKKGFNPVLVDEEESQSDLTEHFGRISVTPESESERRFDFSHVRFGDASQQKEQDQKEEEVDDGGRIKSQFESETADRATYVNGHFNHDDDSDGEVDITDRLESEGEKEAQIRESEHMTVSHLHHADDGSAPKDEVMSTTEQIAKLDNCSIPSLISNKLEASPILPCRTLEEVIRENSPAQPDCLIGRFVGSGTMDIVGELYARAAPAAGVVSWLWPYLDKTDFVRMGGVCQLWRKIVLDNKDVRRHRNLLARIHADPSIKENQLQRKHRCTSPEETSMTRAVKCLGDVQPAVKVPSQKPVSSKIPVFQQLRSDLQWEEFVRQCPLCRQAARVRDSYQTAVCSNPACAFMFCTHCLHRAHPLNHPCPSATGKKLKMADASCSKKSKKNLKRIGNL